MGKEMWCICTVDYFAAVKKMKFSGRREEVENILSEISQAQKEEYNMFSSSQLYIFRCEDRAWSDCGTDCGPGRQAEKEQ